MPASVACVLAVLVAVLTLTAAEAGAQDGGKVSLQLTPGANFALGASTSMFTIDPTSMKLRLVP